MVTVSVQISGRFDYSIYNLAGLSNAADFINFVFDYKRTSGAYRMSDAVKLFEMSTDQERIEKLVAAGVTPSKFVYGVHFAGPAFVMTRSGKDDDAIFSQPYGYGSICKAQINQPANWEKTYGPSGVSIVRKTGGAKQMAVILENSRSIANKVQFAMKRGLVGIAPICIFADDPTGQCGTDENTYADLTPAQNVPARTQNTFPLLRTVKETIDLILGAKQVVNEIVPEVPPTIEKPKISGKPTTQDKRKAPKKPKAQEKSKTSEKLKPQPKLTVPKKTTPKTTPRKDTDRKVVCQVQTQSNLDANKNGLDLRTVDWNLCTHLISVDETGTRKFDKKRYVLNLNLKTFCGE